MDRKEAINILAYNAINATGTLGALPPTARETKYLNEQIKALNMAIEALQEQERKKERCEYCKDGKSFIGQVVILGNDATWHKINYCPNCGADMRKNEEE